MKNIILITAAFIFPVTALAQTKSTMPMMNTNMRMKAPTLMFSAMPNMNMMMSGSSVDISPAPGYRLITHHVIGHVGTLTYASTDSRGLFDFYSKALGSEGWKERANMNLGRMRTGAYAQSYIMRISKLDLKTTTSGKYTTVLIRIR